MNYRDYLTQHPRWGKLIGAVLGFVMSGPVGMLVGIFVGNLFDQGLAQHLAKPLWHFRQERRPLVRALFVQATFSIMGYIAKANGRVTEQSIRIAKQTMRGMGLNQEQRNLAQHAFTEGKKSTFQMEPLLFKLRTSAHDSPSLLKLFATIQYQHAEQIGFSTPIMNALNEVLVSMGLAPLQQQSHFRDPFEHLHQRRHYQQHHSSSSSSRSAVYSTNRLAQAYATLSVQSDANKEEIKRAYRRLISLHHPDKMMSKGASAQAIKAANEKTQAITKAYEQICESKGW